MKIKISSHKADSGGVLYYVLGVALVIGAALAGYLSLVSNENIAVQRSQTWNNCIAVAEAGVEEALAHINFCGLTNLATQGWESESNHYVLQRSIGDSYYRVKITSSDPPIIYSSGYVPLPLSTDHTVARTVETRTVREPLWPKAIIVKDTIDLKGNNVNVDSFISTDERYSSNGRYDFTKRRDHGDIATNSSITNSFNAGNANIAGRVSTGPDGSVKLGSNGKIGSLDWVSTNSSGLQPGYFSDDMNVSLPPVRQPYTTGITPSSGEADGTNYDYVLGKDLYILSTINNNTIYVQGNASLLVTDSLKISKGGFYIAPGASLTLYVSAPSANIGGDGIINANASANSFTYYGLTNNTSLSLSGNSTFTGVIYAPNTDVTLGGGGTTPLDFTGSLICKSLIMNGHYNIHYDEALRETSPTLMYVGSTWNEL